MTVKCPILVNGIRDTQTGYCPSTLKKGAKGWRNTYLSKADLDAIKDLCLNCPLEVCKYDKQNKSCHS